MTPTEQRLGSLDLNEAPRRPDAAVPSHDGSSTIQAAQHPRRRIGPLEMTTTPLQINSTSISRNVLPPPHVVETWAQQPGSAEWDFLSRWQNVAGDREVDILHEDPTDDEEEDDETSMANTEEAPREFDRPDQSIELTKEEVLISINNFIDQHSEHWPKDRLLAEMNLPSDPEDIRKKLKTADHRQQYIEQYKRDIAYYTDRLNFLCDEIMGSDDLSERSVGQQCRSLEVTLDELLLAEWLHSVYDPEPQANLDGDAISSQSKEAPNTRLFRTRPYAGSGTVRNIEVNLGTPEPSSGAPRTYTPSEVRSQNRVLQRSRQKRPDGVYGDDPQLASLLSIRKWSWSDLVESSDRKRVLSTLR